MVLNDPCHARSGKSSIVVDPDDGRLLATGLIWEGCESSQIVQQVRFARRRGLARQFDDNGFPPSPVYG